MSYEQQELEQDNDIMEETDTGFVFDFNRLEHRRVTTSSLTDLYGYPVFSETFSLQVEQFHNNRRDGIEQSFRRVFAGEQDNDLDEIFSTVMQAESNLIIQPTHEFQPPPESPLLLIGFVSVGMLAACVVWFFVERIRKKRKKT